jgi:tRNA A37 threonylcarbamoyladenosine dehydratase
MFGSTCPRSGVETSTSSTARIDEERVMWLVERGYDVIVDAIDAIPADISDKIRLLLGRRR